MNRLENDEFSKCHPIVGFLFFIGAIGMGALILHPAYVLASIVGAAAYYFLLHGSKGRKVLLYTIPVFLVLSFINPLVNTDGQHVLTHVFGRPYTLEALLYGMVIAGMLVAMLLWAGCYNAVMTSDKFMSLFGGLIPTVSMMLLMVLRLIPNMIRKTKQIAGARRCIGRGVEENNPRKEKILESLNVISALLTWALEGGIITADAMTSRGYGSGKRTNFEIFTLKKRDILLLILLGVLAAAVITLIVRGATAAAYTPEMSIEPVTGANLFGFVCYCIFLLMPAILYLKEAISWRISRSGI